MQGWPEYILGRMGGAYDRMLRENEAKPATAKMGARQIEELESLFGDAASAYQFDRCRRRVLLAMQPMRIRVRWAGVASPEKMELCLSCPSLSQPLLPQQQLLFDSFVHPCWKGSGAARQVARALTVMILGCTDATVRPSSLSCLEAIVQQLRAVTAAPAAAPSDHLQLLRGLAGEMEAALQEEQDAAVDALPALHRQRVEEGLKASRMEQR